MKSTVFATLAGLATAGGSLRSDELPGSLNYKYSSSSASYGSSGINGINGNYQGSALGGLGGAGSFGSGYSSSASGGSFAINSSGGVNIGNAGLSAGTALSNVGTGAVLVTADNGGASKIVSGQVITDGSYPKADLAVLQTSSSLLVNNNVVANNVINNAYANTYSPNVSIDSLFSKLPSSAQLDNLILSADSVALLKTIQAVGTNTSLPCGQRIAYLLQLNGRLKAAVAKKTFAALQLKTVIDAATVQITRLQGLITNNQALIDKLGIDGLKTSLNTLLASLQSSYVSYNQVQSQIPAIQAQIDGQTQQIQIFNKNSAVLRNGIANDKLKLSDVINQINSIQIKLKDLKDKQVVIQANIDKGVAKIADNDKAIVILTGKIDEFQLQIKGLTDQADQFNAQTKDLQVKVGRLRTDISVNQAKRAKLLKDNADLNDLIAVNRKRNIPDQLNKLTDMLASLKNFVPTIQSQIDRHYYYCFGDGKVQVQTTGGVLIYIVRGQAFGNYLRNLYGPNVVAPAVNGDVLFNRVNIFGDNWVGNFGYPFELAALGGNGNDFSIDGSFGCLNPGSLVSGYGTVSAIGADYIQCAGNDGAKMRFGLGSCSRLESTHKVPAVGQKFYWSGVPQGKGYNLYTGSCFD